MSTKRIQIIGGFPQSDWNQTDESKIDYIKNKPTGLATETYVDNKVADLVNSAPETLDTLNELSFALGDDPNFATTVATQIGTKVDKVVGTEGNAVVFGTDGAIVDSGKTVPKVYIVPYYSPSTITDAQKTEIVNIVNAIKADTGEYAVYLRSGGTLIPAQCSLLSRFTTIEGIYHSTTTLKYSIKITFDGAVTTNQETFFVEDVLEVDTYSAPTVGAVISYVEDRVFEFVYDGNYNEFNIAEYNRFVEHYNKFGLDCFDARIKVDDIGFIFASLFYDSATGEMLVQSEFGSIRYSIRFVNESGTITCLCTAPIQLTNNSTFDETDSMPASQASTATWVKNYIAENASGNVDLTNYALKSELPTKLSELSEDSTHRVVTDAEKTSWNAKSDFSGAYADLTGKPTIPTVPTKVSAFTNDAGYMTSYTETDPTVPAWAKASTKPTYTASEVGADASGTASSVVSAHNTNTSAHADIREQLSQLSSEKVDKINISLGIASDGLLYVFINGEPVGTGFTLGVTSDVYGYVDENNTVVLNGNLADGVYTIKYEVEDGTTKEIGDLTVGEEKVYYTVSKNLTLCTANNSTVSVEEGGSYSATITANDGYMLSSVVVTMGGVDISSSAVSGGNISITNVTGNIVITAVAEEIKVTYQRVDYIANSDQDSYVDLGIVNTETTGIQIKYEYANVSFSLGNSGGFGVMGNADLAIGTASTTSADLRAYWGGIKSYQLASGVVTGTEYTVGVNYCGAGKSAIDGTLKNWNSGTKTFAKSETLTLCKQNGGKNFTKTSVIKIKEVYISEGSSDTHHFVPVYRNVDGVMGMYDIISGTFIPVTGTFTKGADVEGTYDGSATDIPTPEEPDTPDTPTTYTNRIPLSVDSSGNPYNGGQGWKTGYRLSGSSGNESAESGTEVTGFIPVKKNDTVYLKNITDSGSHVIGFYNSSYAMVTTSTYSVMFGGAISGEVVSRKVDGEINATDEVAYMRVSATEITANSIITVNEAITE